jgi:RNA polymerase sigma factor (sigma-70 family)
MGDVFASISNASMIVYRCIDVYNWSRGFKFSTYATWALIKASNRELRPDSADQIVKGNHGKKVDSINVYKLTDHRQTSNDGEDTTKKLNGLLVELAKEDDRTVQIIRMRSGLDDAPKTLDEVGRVFGITKERVRQVQNRGMKKLRQLAMSKYPSLFKDGFDGWHPSVLQSKE